MPAVEVSSQEFICWFFEVGVKFHFIYTEVYVESIADAEQNDKFIGIVLA